MLSKQWNSASGLTVWCPERLNPKGGYSPGKQGPKNSSLVFALAQQEGDDDLSSSTSRLFPFKLFQLLRAFVFELCTQKLFSCFLEEFSYKYVSSAKFKRLKGTSPDFNFVTLKRASLSGSSKHTDRQVRTIILQTDTYFFTVSQHVITL